MPRIPKQIAVTAASVVAVGAFGAGAFALAKDGASFDPSAFVSAYNDGSSDKGKGYEAKQTDTDADANRDKGDRDKDEGGADTDNTAQQSAQQSDMPIEGASGTTAVRVTDTGTNEGVSVANGSGSGSGSDSKGTTVTGPVIPDGGTKGDGAGGQNGSQGGNNGNNGNQGALTPTENSYKLLPRDTVPSEKKLDSMLDDKPVNDSNSAINNITSKDVLRVVVSYNPDADNAIYAGQRLDAWTIFTTLRASYVYMNNAEDMVVCSWVCRQDDFADYEYFRVTDFPATAPSGTFTVKGQYRINKADSWHDWKCEIEPSESCTYVVSSESDGAGGRKVIAKYYSGTLNMYQMSLRLMSSLGYCDVGGDNLTHVLLGWYEGSTELGGFYTPEAGRHVLSPGAVKALPKGCSAAFTGEYAGENGSTYIELQTLTGVESTSEVLVRDAEGNVALKVPEGIQKVALKKGLEVDTLTVPATVVSVDTSGDKLKVKGAYRVDKDNELYAATSDGILTDKAGTAYCGIPTDRKKLTVPADVKSVDFPEDNELKTVRIEGDGTELPELNGLSNVRNCKFILSDDAVNGFISQNLKNLTADTGNIVVLASDPKEPITVDRGVVMAGGEVVTVADTGSSWAVVDDIAETGGGTFRAGCMAQNPNVTTVVMAGAGSYTFEEGCFADSEVLTIVCATEEQAAYAEAHKAEAGVPDAAVTVLQRTEDDFWYYTEPMEAEDGSTYDAVTLFRAPQNIASFYGTFTADDGTELTPSMIAAWAFKDCSRLEWLQTAEDTWYIGAEAFKGCKSLQGTFLGCPDTLNVEPDAFASCPAMRYLASRAADGEIADEGKPNGSCLMYAPTGAEGYNENFTAFTPESKVADYVAVKQDDGSLILCGSNDDMGSWLVLACGSDLSGQVNLPTETLEIFSDAFADVRGPFTVNWDELMSLQYVDQGAFENSGIEGDLYLGSYWAPLISVGDSAFANCTGIKTVKSEAWGINLGSGAFGNCTGLTSVSIDASDSVYFDLYTNAGAFYGCSSLTDIALNGYDPFRLTLLGPGTPFAFDGSESADADAERIHLTVPEEYRETYLKEWTYNFAGYADYDECYNQVFNDLMNATMLVPTDAEVKAEMSKRLLEGENRLRKMMGMELVTASTVFTSQEVNGYTFDTVGGVTTLTAVPDNAVTLDLSAAAPDTVSSFKVPAGLFKNCKDLERIVLGDKVSSIENGAFEGCDGVTVVLPEIPDDQDEPTLALDGGNDTTPFDFGADIKLEVSDASAEKYLKTWPLRMAGFEDTDMWSMWYYVIDVYQVLLENHPDEEITADQLNYSVNSLFMELENGLRRKMGKPEVDDYRELSSFYDASWYLETMRSGGHAGDDASGAESGADDADDADASGDADSDDVPATGDGTADEDGSSGAADAAGTDADGQSQTPATDDAAAV